MIKFIFENGTGLKPKDAGKTAPGLTPHRFNKLINEYRTTGVMNLPADYIIRSIQGLPADNTGELTTLIIIGTVHV
jgi:hypothetical protein